MPKSIQAYIYLLRLDRPAGIYLLLWPTLWSLWLASDGQPNRAVFLVFVIGVVLMRSAGCVFNDLVDHKIDAQVSRTRDRPLASQQISKTAAIFVATGISILAFILVLTMNWATVAMSVIALGLAISYPFMKRIHALPQVHLGLAFGWAIPMAWVAQTETFPPLSIWLLYLANICWSVAYDTIYALTDKEDDLRIGVKSSAILFGQHAFLITALLQAAVLILLALVGLSYGLGIWFYATVSAGALLFVYQQWLIRTTTDYLRAFNNNVWFGLLIFAGIGIDLLP